MCHTQTQMQWTQQITLARHALHSAIRTLDFSFFKHVQASLLMFTPDPVALLSSGISEVDTTLHALDDMNTGLAFLAQDAFRHVYDSLRTSVGEPDEARLSMIRVDIAHQRQIIEFGIDKVINSAITLVDEMPEQAWSATTQLFIVGSALVSDAMQVCMQALRDIETQPTRRKDLIQLEYTWQTVRTSTEESVAAVRGILNLMSAPAPPPQSPVKQRRNSSIASTNSWIRRLSVAWGGVSDAMPSPTSPTSQPAAIGRRNSVPPSPTELVASVNTSCPTSIPSSRSPSSSRKSPPWSSSLEAMPYADSENDEEVDAFGQSFTSDLGEGVNRAFSFGEPPKLKYAPPRPMTGHDIGEEGPLVGRNTPDSRYYDPMRTPSPATVEV